MRTPGARARAAVGGGEGQTAPPPPPGPHAQAQAHNCHAPRPQGIKKKKHSSLPTPVLSPPALPPPGASRVPSDPDSFSHHPPTTPHPRPPARAAASRGRERRAHARHCTHTRTGGATVAGAHTSYTTTTTTTRGERGGGETRALPPPPPSKKTLPHPLFHSFLPALLMRDLWMWGMTPPPAMVALIRVSSSSSPRMASCRWRGVMRLT